jgi:hypothetical protein
MKRGSGGAARRAGFGLLLCLLASCARYDPPKNTTGIFESCCGGAAHCVPEALVSAQDAQRLGRDSCLPALLCAPDAWLADARFVPPSCTSDGVEGRCLLECLPDVSSHPDRLSQADCAQSQRCVPCFDPLSGDSTGACSLGADPGPSAPPKLFAHCCNGAGRCLPRHLVPADVQDRLAADSCSDPGALCTPDAFLSDASFVPNSCRSWDDAEGRCLLDCLPDVASQLDQLPRASCDDHARCAPCFDPLSGQPTKACTLGGDPGPSEPAKLFPRCCHDLGRCVPPLLVPAAQRDRLDADGCSADALCAPEEFLTSSNVVPMSCRSLADAEGRCLLDCLPEVAAQSEPLPQAGCPAHYACAPCFDPISGKSTGACSQGSDPGASEPPKLFGFCCHDAGRCLPAELVPADQRAKLAADSCSQDALCTPADWLSETPPATCRSLADSEGRCLLDCLPEVIAQAGKLPKATCGDHQLCVPCFDPLTGESSGACNLPGDNGPTEPPKLFPSCCTQNGTPLGTCVPTSSLPADQVSQLPTGLCTAKDYSCVPTQFARGTSLPACRPLFGAGRSVCMPSCFISQFQSFYLSQGSCPSQQKCVPCSGANLPAGACP